MEQKKRRKGMTGIPEDQGTGSRKHTHTLMLPVISDFTGEKATDPSTSVLPLAQAVRGRGSRGAGAGATKHGG